MPPEVPVEVLGLHLPHLPTEPFPQAKDRADVTADGVVENSGRGPRKDELSQQILLEGRDLLGGLQPELRPQIAHDGQCHPVRPLQLSDDSAIRPRRLQEF